MIEAMLAGAVHAHEHALHVMVAQQVPKSDPQHVMAMVIGAEMIPPMTPRIMVGGEVLGSGAPLAPLRRRWDRGEVLGKSTAQSGLVLAWACWGPVARDG